MSVSSSVVRVELARSGAFNVFFSPLETHNKGSILFSNPVHNPCMQIKVSCSTTYLYAVLTVFYPVMFPVSAEIDSVTCSQVIT